jgi:putative ATP-binding cassette transporter
LRQALAPGREGELSDERILGFLRQLNLEHVLGQAGGLDADQNWETLISLREQQLLAILRVLIAAPKFVFLDRIWAALTSNEARQILDMLSEASIGYVSNDGADERRDLYGAVLDCKEGGRWTWTTGRSAP